MVFAIPRGRIVDFQHQNSFSESTFGSSLSSCFYDLEDVETDNMEDSTPLPYQGEYSIDCDATRTPAFSLLPMEQQPQHLQHPQQQLPQLPSSTTPCQQQSLFIEVHSGFCIEFRSVDETWQAIQEGRTAFTKCSCCERQLKSLPDAEFVLCPMCRFISLVGNKAPQSTGRGGLSLGFADDRGGKEAGVAALHHLRNSLDRNSASVPKMGIPQYRH